jgi:hypothetical protein
MTIKLTVPLLVLLLLPASVAAQTVTTQGVDRVGDLTLKVTQSNVLPGASLLYQLNASVDVTYQCSRKGQSVPLDVAYSTTWVEEWTAIAKPNGVIRTAVTLLLPATGGLGGLCSEGWTVEPTWVRYSNLFLVPPNGGDVVMIGSYERTLKQ